jgi:UDP-glucose 4-epimerase
MILVTGGAGYIGSHTVVELINVGFEVVVLDNLYASDLSVIENLRSLTGVNIPFEQVDLKDKDAVLSLADKYKIDGVVHFAAYKAVNESVHNPLKYYENNVVGLINLFHLMKKVNCNNFIFSSSCTVYGEVDKVPVDESFPVHRPFSPYGNTKKMCEEIMEDISKVGDIKSIALRYFNPIGAHSSLMLGDNPKNIDNIMPIIQRVAKGEMESLQVYGNDYPTPDGSCVRDYVHVVDIATAHVQALKRIVEGRMEKSFEVYNLGSEHGYSVLQLIKTFEEVNGVKINYKVVGRRAGDVSQIFSNSTLAKQKLDWKLKYDLKDMLSSSWERDKKQHQ